MPNVNPASKTDPFPDWPFRVRDDDTRAPWNPDDRISIPSRVATCPDCSARLEAEVYEWAPDGDAHSIHLFCRDEPPFSIGERFREWKKQHDTYDWSLETMKAEDYIRETYQIIDDDIPQVLRLKNKYESKEHT